MKTLRIGCGAGFAGDRIPPAADLARRGRLHYLVFECLAERTIALAQLQKLGNPELGYDPLLEARFRAVLADAHAGGTRIITNMGAANPMAAARRVAAIAAELGLRGVRVAAVVGDDVLEVVKADNPAFIDTDGDIAQLGARIVSANAYLGAAPLVRALEAGATVVISGRVSDPALFLAPIMHTFGWSQTDWDRLGQGTVAGHLLECAGQVTGGYFADPGVKDVSGLARLGFPLAEIEADGTFVVTKLDDTGGAVTLQTCKEQLLYEVHDPARYAQPDVIADFTRVTVTDVGRDRVRISGGRGSARSGKLKVSVGYRDGFIGDGQISYAGTGALARGELAREIVRERLAIDSIDTRALRFDLLGVDALHGAGRAHGNAEPYEVRLRVAGRMATAAEAQAIGQEVEALYTNGPAGGGGVSKGVRENIGIGSVFIDEARVSPSVHMIEGAV